MATVECEFADQEAGGQEAGGQEAGAHADFTSIQ